MLKNILAILIISPSISHAEIKERFLNYKEFTLSDESCERDRRFLAQTLCADTDSELKEIHREQFRMRTNAEDTLDEYFVFANSSMGLVKVHRYTDFNQPATYDKNADYCYLHVACYNK